MKRIVLGVILIIIGIFLFIATLTATRVDATNQLFASYLCEPDEALISITRFAGTEDSSDNYYCETSDGMRRDVTLSIVGIALSVLSIPLLAGLGLIFAGARRIQSQQTQKFMGLFDEQDGQSFIVKHGNIPHENMAQVQQVLGAMTGSMTSASQKTLAERLQQIEDARRQGLISRSEYEAAREAILESMDD
ncbi:MAG: hypothetical protein WBC91_12745 [Phototrophicaceae bacterium]